MNSLKALVQYIQNKIQKTTLTGVAGKNRENKKGLNNQSQKREPMSMYNYGVGGNEKKVDANEAIQEIQENKTLLVSKLTNEEPLTPEIVKNLKTVEDVFEHYRPSISIDHETAEGETVKEEFNFKNLGDFSPKKLVENSDFLKTLSVEEEQYNNIIRQLRNNKVLNNMLTDEKSKGAFIQLLKEVAQELETNK